MLPSLPSQDPRPGARLASIARARQRYQFTHAYISVSEGGKLRTVAEAIARDGVTVQEIDRLLADDDGLPRSLLHYAARTGRDVVVDDAPTDPMFGKDSYVVSAAPRSLLAVPVQHQGRLSAVLYVDNALTPHAFPSDRIAMLRSLVAQAAISLENARLYASLEQTVQQRTSELLDARKEAERERDRADTPLVNVLPEPIAAELKRTGRAKPISCPSATVLFTDFKGFTALSEVLGPEALVAELEECFIAFDEIMDRHGVEKLKTIGDAYMAVGGLPIRNNTHPFDAVRAALDIAAYIDAPRGDRPPPPFEVRIGVHTGPLVAGVIGKRRFLYDVWGDTVNTASRMESSGAPGRVNVSAATWELVRGAFVGTHRGKVAAKGKGQLDMYFIEREREDPVVAAVSPDAQPGA